jgi:regulator of RNase E activity RraB
MMLRKITTTFAFATLLTAGAFAAATAKPHPKISMKQARATALKTAPGTVKSEELENEKGKLIYSFDIATSKTEITEVNVDAMNGKVVDVQHENAAKEAAEKKLEAKEKEKAKKQ